MGDAGPDHRSPVQPADEPSGWAFNWWGLVPVLLFAAIAVIAWHWSGGPAGDDGRDATSRRVTAVSAPTDSVEYGAPSTAPVRSTSTTRPARALASSTTITTATSERRVLITGEIKPCRFADRCLVASFTIEGFEEHPGRYSCIYATSRSDFSFNDDDVDDACFTADSGDTITIEVAGVRSARISERNLDGT